MKTKSIILTVIAMLAFSAILFQSCKKGEVEQPFGEGGTTDTFTDPRDGQTYATVKIGNQTWLAENLKYLPSVSSPYQGSTFDHAPYYYVYDYYDTVVSEAKVESHYQTYGVLYNWYAALTACPNGWHLPSDEEWTTLTTYLGGEYVAGGKMKETGTTHWIPPNTGATNSSGFTALPGGYRFEGGGATFQFMSYYGNWWSASEYNKGSVWFRSLDKNEEGIYRTYNSKDNGFSVRCIRDN